ncbi:hypothetical protein [Paraburkholderia pallida]|uniref:hypothetical protein n=1 Tax=Paraburkholderia pallida TaxID=2547399 RepID=UPI001E2985B9|nr:hypothetical protein [Paraburkholderia pallida]
MNRPSAALASPCASSVPACKTWSNRPWVRGALKRAAALGATTALLALSGCYYYYPYGYAPYYYGSVPAAGTQQDNAVMQTSPQASQPPNPAPAAIPDAQYPGPLYPSPPVAIAVPAWPAYPAYYPYPAWGWGGPSISFGFGYWGGGGGYWRH